MIVTCKSILLGDSRVGKTTLLHNVVLESTRCSSETIGIDFRFVSGYPNSRVMLWDVSGRELFRPIIKPHYRHTHLALFVFDMSQRASFLNIPLWYNEYQKLATPKAMVLVANQKSPMMVDSVEGRILAKRLGMRYVETNLLTDNADWVHELYLNVLALLKEPSSTKDQRPPPRGCLWAWTVRI